MCLWDAVSRQRHGVGGGGVPAAALPFQAPLQKHGSRQHSTSPSLPNPPPPNWQTTVEIATSYADSGVYQFNQVFDEGYTHQDVFERLTPVINDAFLGINGAIMVSGGRRGHASPASSSPPPPCL